MDIKEITLINRLTGQDTGSDHSKVVKANRCTMKKHNFDDTLLIIMFNSPLYTHIPLLKEFYKPVFQKIMCCGPVEDKHYNVTEARVGGGGYFGYDCLAKGIRMFPNFHGYLYVNDDMIVNYWNFAKLDRQKIWIGTTPKVAVGKKVQQSGWFWWNTPYGIKACQKNFKNISALQKTNTGLKESVKMLRKNIFDNNPLCLQTFNIDDQLFFCMCERSDFFYLPAKLSRMFLQLEEIFLENRVFLEITIPTIARMLDSQKNFEYLKGIYLLTADASVFWAQYNTSIDFLHAIKFNGTSATLHQALFKNLIPFVSKRICLK